MTEINIERKRRAAWLWAVSAVILLALVAWWLLDQGSRDGVALDVDLPGVPAAVATDTAAGALPTAVDDFVRWADGERARTAMGPEHEYTATGIRRLASALEALARPNAGANVERELATLRAQADTLQRNAPSTVHADYTRKAFVTLAALMTTMQQERFPAARTDVAEVRRAAEAVRADRMLLDQRARVQEFFDQAAVAVRRMSAAAR